MRDMQFASFAEKFFVLLVSPFQSFPSSKGKSLWDEIEIFLFRTGNSQLVIPRFVDFLFSSCSTENSSNEQGG